MTQVIDKTPNKQIYQTFVYKFQLCCQFTKYKKTLTVKQKLNYVIDIFRYCVMILLQYYIDILPCITITGTYHVHVSRNKCIDSNNKVFSMMSKKLYTVGLMTNLNTTGMYWLSDNIRNALCFLLYIGQGQQLEKL